MTFKFKKVTDANVKYTAASMVGSIGIGYIISRWIFSPFY